MINNARENHRRRLAFLLVVYAGVIVGGFLIGAGVRHWSRETAIPFESTAMNGPAWGHVIPEISLSGKTFAEAVQDLAAASGARIEVLWGTLPPYFIGSMRVPDGVSLRNVELGQALTLLISLCEKDEDHWEGRIVCRAVKGRICIAAADAGPAVAPAVCAFDVRDVLASMMAYRASHPGFQPDMSESFGMSADNLMSSMPDGSSPLTTTCFEDLSDFLKFTASRSMTLHMSDGICVVDGRLVTVQPPEMLDDIGVALAGLRAAGHRSIAPAANEPIGLADASAQLEKMLPTVDIGPALLPDAVERLRQMSGANIHVNWKRLRIEDLNTRQYELHSRNIALRDALGSLLNGLPLRIRSGRGVISIMDSELLDWKSVEVHAYVVNDLLDGHRKLPATEATRFGPSRVGIDPRTHAAEELIDAIVAAVPDERWPTSSDTSDIRMTIVCDLLLVRQTPTGQLRIKAFLARLREGR